MSPGQIQTLTWVTVVVVLFLYGVFIVWRIRVDRRKKAAREEMLTASARPLSGVFQGRHDDADPPTPAPTPPPPGPPPAAATPAAAAPSAPGDVAASPLAGPELPTVASMVQGIQLPCGLVPLTSVQARGDAIDLVAFWTDQASAEMVGRGIADELERLGYAVDSLDEESIRARRDGHTLLARLLQNPTVENVAGIPSFPSVPPGAVVLELWIPDGAVS